MKKVIVLIMFILAVSFKMQANPGPDPEINIYEFYFEPTGGWVLKLYFRYCTAYTFDSLSVQSNSGIQKIMSWTGSATLITVKSSDLSGILNINPDGDIVTINGYLWMSFTASLRFGNVPDANVFAPLSGQSVSWHEHYWSWMYYPSTFNYSLDNTPNSTNMNDTTGTCGTLHGTIFGPDLNPVRNKYFWIDFGFWTDFNGRYSTRIYSCINSLNKIYSDYFPHEVPIAPMQYGMIPDSSIYRDINLLDTVYLPVQPRSELREPLRLYPNPVKESLTVSWSLDISDPSGRLELEILDLLGRPVVIKTLNSCLGVSVIPLNLPDGNYFAILKNDGSELSSKHFLVTRNR